MIHSGGRGGIVLSQSVSRLGEYVSNGAHIDWQLLALLALYSPHESLMIALYSPYESAILTL